MKNDKAFKRYAQKVSHHPNEKNVHELRKIVREIRCVTDTRSLDKLSKILGKQRDIDVALINAHTFKLNPDKLNKLIKKRRTRTKEYLSKKRIKRLSKIISHEQVLPEGANARLSILRKEVSVWKKKKLNEHNLHSLRLFIKKLRYSLKQLGMQDKRLQILQDRLGEIHDLQSLLAMIGESKQIDNKIKRMTKKAVILANTTLARVQIPLTST